MQAHIEPGPAFSDREPSLKNDSVRFFAPDGGMLFTVRQNVDGSLLIRAINECQFDGKKTNGQLQLVPVDCRTIVVSQGLTE